MEGIVHILLPCLLCFFGFDEVDVVYVFDIPLPLTHRRSSDSVKHLHNA